MFDRSTFHYLLKFVKNKPRYVIFSCILSFIGAICGAISVVFLIPIFLVLMEQNFDTVFEDFSYFVIYFLRTSMVINQDYRLGVLIVLLLFLWAIAIVSSYLNSLVGIRYTKYLIDEMKRASFGLLSRVDLSYYRRNKIGDILFMVNREIDKAALAIKSSQKILTTSIALGVFSSVLLLISLPLSLITIILIGLKWSGNNFLKHRINKKELLLSQKLKIYNRKTIEFLTGINYIKNTANESGEYNKIINSMTAKSKAELNALVTSSLLNSINKISNAIAIVVLISASYYLYDRQIQIFMPIILVYLLILFKLLPLLAQLGNIRRQFANNKLSVEIVANFLNEIDKPIVESGAIFFKKLDNNIELHNVVFAYPNHAQIVLDKINLKIQKGNTIALVGSPNAGKSTLVSLLSRLYEPIEGKITIDDRDISQYTIDSLRKSIAVIDRETFLFSNSIFYNITYGLPNFSNNEVVAAAKKTKAYDFIVRLPQEFETKIGDRNIVLSEAQRQLIAITRALLSNPEIVILDDSMRNVAKLDRELVQSALNQLCRDRTTIIITNRLATIEKADKIVILNRGKLVESGTHQELLENGNLYKKMCATQFKASQQSHQQLLAKKISQKLSRQANNNLSYEIKNNLNSLLNYLQLIDRGLIKDDLEQEKILDESYQSAKNMLASLKEYERKISLGLDKNDRSGLE